VLWTVFAEPVEASEAQIDAFAAVFPMNARPLQKLNRRFVLASF
jgi:carbonic anhydrase